MAYGSGMSQTEQGADTMRLFHRAMPGQCLVVIGQSAHVVNSNWVGTVNRRGPWVDAIALEAGEAGDIIRVAMRHGSIFNLTDASLPAKSRRADTNIGTRNDVDPLNAMSLPKADGLLWLGRDGYIKPEPEGSWAVMVGRMVDSGRFIFDPQPPANREVCPITIDRFVISGDGLPGGSASEDCQAPFGHTITNVTMDASFSEEPTSMQVSVGDNPPVIVSSFPCMLPQGIAIDADIVPVKLTITSADGKTTSRTITITAQHIVFWGSELINGSVFRFSERYCTKAGGHFAFNAPGENEYGWFGAPSHWGTPQFWDVTGLLQGGFEFFNNTVREHVQYSVYRTDYPKLGEFTMNIRWE